MKLTPIARKYLAALESLIGRPLTPQDGLPLARVIACERRLKLKLPAALKIYYELAGKHPINTQHNQLYSPEQLNVENGKLVFMEENQAVVFWGLSLEEPKKSDPMVYPASNETKIIWYAEGRCFSDWIIKMWRWQAGLDPGL